MEMTAKLKAQEVKTKNKEIAEKVSNKKLKEEYDRSMAILSSYAMAAGLPLPTYQFLN